MTFLVKAKVHQETLNAMFQNEVEIALKTHSFMTFLKKTEI